MTTHIRKFAEADYAAVTALHNATYPEFELAEDELRYEDQTRPPKCRQARWLAESDGRAVGFARYVQQQAIYHPRKFNLDVCVDLTCLGQGIGRALYHVLVHALRPLDPLQVDMWTREDMFCRVRFLERRGFQPTWADWSSELELATFDPSRFAVRAARVETDGVRIVPLSEFDDTPELRRQLYDLWCDVRGDMPLPPGETRSPVAFEEWLERQQHPSIVPQAYFLAIADGHMVGLSHLERAPREDIIRTGLTGVRRAYRRRGIAVALKLRAMEYAREQGYRAVSTDNAADNVGMLAINDRFGFVRRPAWLRYTGEWATIEARCRQC